MDADVTIVGAGPTGLVLAILLGQRGVAVTVLEAYPERYPLPRAVHFDGEAARILQACGVGDEAVALGMSVTDYQWCGADGRTLLRFDWSALASSGWPTATMFAQPELETLLERRLAALPSVTLRRGATVHRIDGALAFVGDTAVRSRFLVGADGASSLVRATLDLGMIDLGHRYDWLVCDVRPPPHRVWHPTNLQVCDPARPTTAVSGGPGRRRFEFLRLPGEDPRVLDTDDTAWRLLGRWGLTPADTVLERRALYTTGSAWVRSWRRGNVLLAGDAAHQMPPFAGQGLCSGLRDAASLAWRLVAVLRGEAPETLLDSYGTERGEHVREVTQLSVELGTVICVTDPVAAAERDAAMAPTGSADAGPPPVIDLAVGLIAGETPGAGTTSPQGRIRLRGRTGRADDLLGAGWQVLTGTAHPMATCCLDADSDLDGVYRAWFAELGRPAVVVRPDFVVYGSADLAGLPDLLARRDSDLRG